MVVLSVKISSFHIKFITLLPSFCTTYSLIWKKSYTPDFCSRRAKTRDSLIFNYRKECADAVAAPAYNQQL